MAASIAFNIFKHALSCYEIIAISPHSCCMQCNGNFVSNRLIENNGMKCWYGFNGLENGV